MSSCSRRALQKSHSLESRSLRDWKRCSSSAPLPINIPVTIRILSNNFPYLSFLDPCECDMKESDIGVNIQTLSGNKGAVGD